MRDDRHMKIEIIINIAMQMMRIVNVIIMNKLIVMLNQATAGMGFGKIKMMNKLICYQND